MIGLNHMPSTMMFGIVLLTLVGAVSRETVGQQGPTGDLSVVGEVSVNGVKVETGDLIFPGSRIHTAKGSSAVVSLGKLGRVDVMPSTVLLIRWDDSSIHVSIVFGTVRVVALEGTSTTVITKDGVVASADTEPTTFTVNTECRNTLVSTELGLATLRAGDTIIEVHAGLEGTAGRPIGKCRRER